MMRTAILAIALILGGTVFGQEKTPEQRADRLTEKMTKNLVLTADQMQEISDVNRGIAKKNAAIRENQTFTREQKQEIIASNRDAAKSMYQGILTPEQYTKFLEMEKAAAAKREARKAEKKADKQTELEESEDL